MGKTDVTRRQVTVSEPVKNAPAAAIEPFSMYEEASVVDVPLGVDADPLLRSTFPEFLELRSNAHLPPTARVAKLETLLDAIGQASTESLEYTIYSGEFERWTGKVLGDVELAREISGVRALAKFGEDLRTVLFTVIQGRFSNLAVRAKA